MSANEEKLADFQGRPVTYIETIQVKDGVECDTYSFNGNPSEDLAIVRVAPGAKTPLQRILQGTKTIEGFVHGKGSFMVRNEDGATETYSFDEAAANQPDAVNVRIGQIVQWSASPDTALTFYEICDPPYQNGRFENLPDNME